MRQAVRTIAADSGVSSIDDFSRDEFKLETEVEKNDEEESNATRSLEGLPQGVVLEGVVVMISQ